MTEKMNPTDQLNRMKSLMNYGLKTEGKQVQYSSVEYQKLGADGKVYGIVREGAKYYIKEAPNKKGGIVKENFNYIGGFRNRKNNEYSNFALAQKQFDLKMMSIKEAVNNPTFDIESWNLDQKENTLNEASDKMKAELLRERQIMKNATKIAESCKGSVCPIEKEIAASQKNNIKAEKPKTGDAKTAVDGEKPELPKEMTESAEPLAWHDSNGDPKNDTYMDKSNGTQIGSSAPFDGAKGKDIDDNGSPVTSTGEAKNGVVTEGESMHDSDNQNTPAVGTSEVGDSQPFNKKKGKDITEDLDTDDMDVEDDNALADGEEEGLETAEDGSEDLADNEPEGDEDFDEEDVEEDDLSDRVSAMEDVLYKIADSLGIDEPTVSEEPYEDGEDDLWDDGDDDTEYEFEVEDEDEPEGPIEDDVDMDMPMEGRNRNGVRIIETKNFKKAFRNARRMNEEGMRPFSDNGRVPSGNMNRLNDFGKHPAYRKKVMTLPQTDSATNQGYYDMNDESVYSEQPYGSNIGSGAPFNISPDVIDNSISEAIKRMKKKI